MITKFIRRMKKLKENDSRVENHNFVRWRTVGYGGYNSSNNFGFHISLLLRKLQNKNREVIKEFFYTKKNILIIKVITTLYTARMEYEEKKKRKLRTIMNKK